MKDKLKKFFSKKVVWVVLAAVVVLFVIIINKNGSNKNIAIAKISNVVQKVEVTGKVKPNQNADLGFDKAGKVSNVYFNIGDKVKKGDVIASLDSSELSAELSQAQASLSEAQLNYNSVLSSNPTSYSDASKNLDSSIKDGYTAADDAIRNKIDQFFIDPQTNPSFEVSFTDGNFVHYFNVDNNLKLSINSDRKNIENILINWKERVNAGISDPVSEANLDITNLNKISSFLDEVALAVNSFTSSSYNYDSTVSGYKATTLSARSEVSSAITSIISAKDKFNSSGTLNSSGQLDSVAAAKSKVDQAAAGVALLKASLQKSSIVSPFDGVITVQDAKIGQAVSGGQTLVSIISQDAMYVEANVSEVHIGKVSEGNPVSITFDAFPNEKFTGEVSYIEPGEVLVDGVVNYKVRVSINNFNPKIKSGLTTNLEIQTAERDNVLTIPMYAVTEENGKSFVNKITNNKNKTEKIPVELGLVGNDGMVEVLSGLKEGESVSF